MVPTAAEFIDKIASGFFSSGTPYLAKIADKKTSPLREVMLSELRRLELYLKEDRKTPASDFNFLIPPPQTC